MKERCQTEKRRAASRRPSMVGSFSPRHATHSYAIASLRPRAGKMSARMTQPGVQETDRRTHPVRSTLSPLRRRRQRWHRSRRRRRRRRRDEAARGHGFLSKDPCSSEMSDLLLKLLISLADARDERRERKRKRKRKRKRNEVEEKKV